MRTALAIAFLALTSCAALGVRQGDPLDVGSLLAHHRDNPVGAHAMWEGKYIQLSGTVIQTGFVDKKVTSVAVVGNAYYASGQSTEETVRYPFVLLQPEAGAAVVKCVLQPGWSGDLAQVQKGGWMRISAHFVQINDGTPIEVNLRECRVREYQNAPVAAPAAPAATPPPPAADPAAANPAAL